MIVVVIVVVVIVVAVTVVIVVIVIVVIVVVARCSILIIHCNISSHGKACITTAIKKAEQTNSYTMYNDSDNSSSDNSDINRAMKSMK